MRPTLVFLAACVTSMCHALPVAAPLGDRQMQIELRPHFIARHPEVRLGDIAILHTRDLPTIEQLSALWIGQAPRTGAEMIVRRDMVARWVRSQLGIELEQVLWTGPEETRVHSMSQEFPAGRIERAAKLALRSWLGTHAGQHRVETLALASDVKLPGGTVELKVRPLGLNARPTPRMVVWVDVHVDGRPIRTVAVSFAVEAYRELGVARAGRNPGYADMNEDRESELSRPPASGVPISRRPNYALRDSRATEAPGESERHTTGKAPAPGVARGDWVVVHLSSGLVELEGRAQALQDGEVGQLVTVRPAKGASPVQARVVAPGHVEATL